MQTDQQNSIHIRVETNFLSEQSNLSADTYFFAYKILIENNGEFPVKLLRRHWLITGANGKKREVVGEGVVGQQPVIEPNDFFQYVSGCPLECEMGTMSGFYIFENRASLELFEVAIPKFYLVVPFKLN